MDCMGFKCILKNIYIIDQNINDTSTKESGDLSYVAIFSFPSVEKEKKEKSNQQITPPMELRGECQNNVQALIWEVYKTSSSVQWKIVASWIRFVPPCKVFKKTWHFTSKLFFLFLHHQCAEWLESLMYLLFIYSSLISHCICINSCEYQCTLVMVHFMCRYSFSSNAYKCIPCILYACKISCLDVN